MKLLTNTKGYFLHPSAVSQNVWKKLDTMSKVYAAVSDKNPVAKRAKASGRTVKGECVTVIHKCDNGYVKIPRCWFDELPELIQFRTQIEGYRRLRIESTQLIQPLVNQGYTLKQTQEDVLTEFFSYSGIPSGCLALHTGFGKTVVAIELIRRLNVRCLWLSHTNQLLTQFSERVQTFLGVSTEELDTCSSTCPIVTCSIQKLLLRDPPQEVIDSFGLVIVDEVHHMGAPSFSQAFHKIGGIPYTIGLSATLERKDQLQNVFQWSIGPVRTVRELVVKTKPLVKMVQGCWEVPIQKNKQGDPIFSLAITDLARNTEYNECIIHEIINVLTSENDRRVLVLTDRKEQVLILDAIFKEKNTTFTTGMLYSDTRTENVNTCHVLFATYGIAGEGFDCPGLNCVLLATPRNDMRQAVGRILGERAGVVRPLIIDIHNTMGLFYNQGRERKKFYISAEFEVIVQRKKKTHNHDIDDIDNDNQNDDIDNHINQTTSCTTSNQVSNMFDAFVD